MLVSDVIDRCLDRNLYPAGKGRPAFRVLSGSINDSVTSVVFTASTTKDPSPDSVYEIESELLLGSDFNPDTDTATINERGWLETTAASHASGLKAWINPTFPRIHVQNALQDLIRLLYPWGVYKRTIDTTLNYSDTAPVSLPTGTLRLLSVRAYNPPYWSDPLVNGRDFDYFSDATTQQIQLYRGGTPGQDLRIVYAADFDVSTFTEATNLSTVGIPDDLQPFLSFGTAGLLLSDREIPRVQLDEIRKALSAVAGQVAVGSSLQIGQAMLQTFESRYVAASAKRLDLLDLDAKFSIR